MVLTALLTALSTLALQQTKLLESFMSRLTELLDYITSQNPVIITYRKTTLYSPETAIHATSSQCANAQRSTGGHHSPLSLYQQSISMQ